MVLLTLILVGCLKVAFGKDCIINNVPEQMAWEKQLRSDLDCDYDYFDPPKRNSTDSLNVHVDFWLKYYQFDSSEEVFIVRSWTFVSWVDERLKWDPEKYSGINKTEILSHNLWTPSFRLYNSADSYDFDGIFSTNCILANTGNITCVPKMYHQAWCNVKLTNWPYDVQECSLEFGALTSKWLKLKMSFPSPAITVAGAKSGAGWVISDYRQVEDHNSERQLKMTFVLKRQAVGLAALLVYPAGILSALSMTCLFLDVRRRVRLGVACFSLLGHYYFLTELAMDIPKQTASPPTILLYYRSSVIVTVTIILSTFLLSTLCKWKSTPQNYILSINEFVYESYGRYLVFPRWDMDEGPDDKRISEDWTKFANIVNSVFVFIILITYISLYCTLIPKPVSK